MKAMILAAGLGTRLKPLTDKVPKALIEVEGVPMLERIILRLKKQGFDYIVVNVHHLSEQIITFLNSRDYGVEVMISDESDGLLDTGGGIVRAFPLIFKNNCEPVLIHNVDILSNADLTKLMDGNSNLLVSDRESTRKLIFDDEMTLVGWHNLSTNEYRPKKPEDNEDLKEYAFSGIYSLTYETISEMKRIKGEKPFPVMDYFLDSRREIGLSGIVGKNLRILDIGKPATLSQAAEFI